MFNKRTDQSALPRSIVLASVFFTTAILGLWQFSTGTPESSTITTSLLEVVNVNGDVVVSFDGRNGGVITLYNHKRVPVLRLGVSEENAGFLSMLNANQKPGLWIGGDVNNFGQVRWFDEEGTVTAVAGATDQGFGTLALSTSENTTALMLHCSEIGGTIRSYLKSERMTGFLGPSVDGRNGCMAVFDSLGRELLSTTTYRPSGGGGVLFKNPVNGEDVALLPHYLVGYSVLPPANQAPGSAQQPYYAPSPSSLPQQYPTIRQEAACQRCGGTGRVILWNQQGKIAGFNTCTTCSGRGKIQQ